MKKGQVVLIVLVAACAVYAGWDSARPTKPVQPLEGYISQAPLDVQQNYGNTERTQVYYNLISLDERVKRLEAANKNIMKQLAELKVVPEVNDVADPNGGVK